MCVSMGMVLFDTFLDRIEWIEEVHRFRQEIRGFRSSLNVIFMLISEKIVKKRGFLSEFTLQHEKEIVKVCKLEQGKF